MPTSEAIISAGVALISGLLSWLLADARSKGRAADMALEVDRATNALNGLEIRTARSEQDRSEMHRSLERLEEQKANKELVDAFRNEIAVMRTDFNARFDRLETLIRDKN